MVHFATYVAGRLGTGMAAPDRLISVGGTVVPLPRTDADRKTAGDSRPSVESLYRNRTRFMRQVDSGISSLIAGRFLLPADSLVARNRMSDVLTALGDGGFHPFEKLFNVEEGRPGIIVTFLALLELAKEHLIEIMQSQPLARIYLKSRPAAA